MAGDPVVVEASPARVAVLLAEDEVFRHGELHDQPAALSVLRDVRQPAVGPLAHGVLRDVVRTKPDGAGHDWPKPGERLQQFRLPVAFHAGDPEDLPGTHGEGERLDRHGPPIGAHGQCLHLQANRSGRFGTTCGHRGGRRCGRGVSARGALRIKRQLDITPHHGPRNLTWCRPRGRKPGHGAPGPHDGDHVGDGEHFVQLVRDEDHRAAGGAQRAQYLPELRDFRRGQDGRWLIQNQHARAPVERLEDLHPLGFADGELRHEPTGIHMQPAALTEGRDLRLSACPIQAESSPRFLTEHHILGDRERGDQHEVLVHQPDAGGNRLGGRPAGDSPSVDLHLTAIRGVEPCQHAHERALPRAILANERMDLAGRHIKGGVPVGHDAVKGLQHLMQADGQRPRGHGPRRLGPRRHGPRRHGVSRVLGTTMRPAMMSAARVSRRAFTVSGTSARLLASST